MKSLPFELLFATPYDAFHHTIDDLNGEGVPFRPCEITHPIRLKSAEWKDTQKGPRVVSRIEIPIHGDHRGLKVQPMSFHAGDVDKLHGAFIPVHEGGPPGYVVIDVESRPDIDDSRKAVTRIVKTIVRRLAWYNDSVVKGSHNKDLHGKVKILDDVVRNLRNYTDSIPLTP